MKLVEGATTAVRRLLDALLIGLIVVVLLGVILGKVVPLTGRQTLIVGGPSMEPALLLGSAVIVRAIDPGSLAVGDIVSLQPGPGSAVFTHRIVEVVDRADGRWVRTKGDANATPDPTLVPASAIIGRTELAIPYAGYLLALMTLPTGIVFLLGLAGSLLAAAWLLESLELQAADRKRRSIQRPVAAAVSPSLARGEPIAVRPPTPGSGTPATPSRAPLTMQLAAAPASTPTPFGGPTGMGVGERIAATRQTRRRRERWQADSARRTSRGRD